MNQKEYNGITCTTIWKQRKREYVVAEGDNILHIVGEEYACSEG